MVPATEYYPQNTRPLKVSQNTKRQKTVTNYQIYNTRKKLSRQTEYIATKYQTHNTKKKTGGVGDKKLETKY